MCQGSIWILFCKTLGLTRVLKVFVDEPTKRARCAQLLGAEVTKALASSSSTGSSKQKVDERFPRNLREIRLVQHRFRSRLLKVRKELRAKVKVRFVATRDWSTTTDADSWQGLRRERQRLS